MQNKFTISDYYEADYQELIGLWQSTGLGNPNRGDDNEVIKRTIEIGGKLLIMKSNSDNRIVGSSWMTTDGRRLFLHHFGILPDFQGQGLANKLMEETLKFAKEFGQQFKLEVHHENHKAINLYEKFGFDYLGDYDVYIIRNIQDIKLSNP